MCPKVKYNDNTKATKKFKRMLDGINLWSGWMPTGTVPKTVRKLSYEKYNPVVFRVMKRSELDAIPRDRYDVKVIKVIVPLHETGEVEGEEELLVAITNSEQLTKRLKTLRQNMRIRIRDNNGGGGNPPSSNPFREPIDQHKMADCILQVMDDFFHGEDKCTICDKEFSNMEFCVMTHIFLKKIHFLKKETRLQFSKFAQKRVFAGKSGFIRSYNTYAGKDIYKDFEKQLDIKQFNFKNHPVPIPPEKKSTDFHQRMIQDMSLAFQEIGRAFQKSPYFKELKELKETLNEFVLQ